MTLLESVRELRSRIVSLSDVERSVHQRQIAAQRNKELVERNNSLDESMRPLRWLGVTSTAEHDKAVASARQGVAKVKHAIAEGKSVDVLTKGATWVHFLNQLDGCSAAIREIAKRNWREKVDTHAGLPKPDEISRTLGGTPENLKNLEDYRYGYAQLAEIAGLLLPRNALDVNELVVRAKRVREIRERFDFSVPTAVKTFLDAAVSPDGASLELLSDDVRAWLDDQNLAGHYVVRAKGR
jgi:hypothetical protein